jgi:hypothetical protein
VVQGLPEAGSHRPLPQISRGMLQDVLLHARGFPGFRRRNCCDQTFST